MCPTVEKLLVVGSKDTMMITTITIEIEAHIMEEKTHIIQIVIHTTLKVTEIGTINPINMLAMNEVHMTGE